MLRAGVAVGLRLGIVFAALGLLIARTWGWSEYASNELYLIHWQQVGPKGQWRIIDAGGGASEALTLDGKSILALDCAPDGRTLALLSGAGNVHLITSGGVTADRKVDMAYDSLTVANDGSIALYQPQVGGVRIEAGGSRLLANPLDPNTRYHVAVAAAGWQLWNAETSMVQLVTPDGVLVRSVYPVSAGRWLADEQLFSFGTLGETLTQYFMEAARPGPVTLHQAPGIFSPDGLTRAVALRDEQHGSYRTYIGAAFGDAHLKPIPRDPGASDWPVCFVTFKPGVLISPGS